VTDEQFEAEGLAGVVTLLRYADPEEVEHPAEPPANLEDRIITRVRAEQGGKVVDLSERRSRRPAVLAAAAAVVAVIILGVGIVAGFGDDTPSGRTVELAGAESGFSGSVELSETEDETVLRLVASGLDPDQVYAAWLAPDGGDKQAAGTFRPDNDGEVDVELLSGFPLDDAARVWVTDPAGETVLNAPLT
jgi:anti-sigma-K factor RskA